MDHEQQQMVEGLPKPQVDEETEHFIGEIDKAPQFMTFNPHVTEGYRINHQHPSKIIKSLFQMHNQTLNIWTHLIGAIVVFCGILSFFLIIDKAELDYQLKSYEQSLTGSFEKLDSVIDRVYETTHPENGLKSSYQTSQVESFKKQVWNEIDQISQMIRESSDRIKLILTKNVTLTEEESKLQEMIRWKLSSLQRLEPEIRKNLKELLTFFNVSLEKARAIIGNLDRLQNSIKEVRLELTELVIAYLEVEKQSPNPYAVPRWPVLVFLYTATLCMACSATFHLFMSMSHKAFIYFRRLDYAGVIINIIGTGVAPIYYTRYCDFALAYVYMGLMALLGSMVFATLMGDWIQNKRNQKYKPILFLAFGFTYLIPYFHFMISDIFFDNFNDPFRFSNANHFWLLSTASYLVGIVFLVKHFPQSKFPKIFDYVGSSHQLWHVMCLFGVGFTYVAINVHYEDRKICQCPQQL